MRFLIDGYNLMHQLGMAPKPGGLSLERSRLRFVEWLASELGNRKEEMCIVFDSVRASRGREQVHRGIRLRFADARTADDQIEEWIVAETMPSQLTVVSSDRRIQSAASRRGCIAWTCGMFVDWLQARTPTAAESARGEGDEKPSSASEREIDDWLERFGR